MLCPQCVQEQGFIDVFWDLHYAIVCPRHQCQLLRVCPSCRQSLHWLRPGLLVCKCGADLVEKEPKSAEVCIIELMEILKAKLHGSTIVTHPNTMNYPLKEIENLSLFSFFWMLAQLGKFSFISRGMPESKDPYQTLLEASEVISNWPSGYHKFLQRLGMKFKEKGLPSTGLRKQFKKYYLSMFENRSHPTEQIKFLRNEFIAFGLHSWGMAVVDNKLLNNTEINIENRFLSKTRLASELGVSPTTLRNWLKKGMLPYKKVMVDGNVRYILDKQSLDLVKRVPGKTLELREAAAFLQMPVSVLMSLKESGYYVVKHLPKYIPGFHEADLNNFAQMVFKKSAIITRENLNNNFISLDYILKEKRFWSKKGKASIVEAYLDGKILSIGRTSDSIKDIWFHKVDVENFISKSRMKTNEKTISQIEAAKVIDCILYAIPVLISNGFLIGLPGPNRVRVKHESANEFSNRYISFSTLSIKLNTSSKRLLDLCQKKGIEILSIETKEGNITSFIKKEKLTLLTYQFSRNPTREVRRKVAVQNNISSLMKLKFYLKHIRKKGLCLPRQNLIPNKCKIADICGISRGVFYYDPDANKMLDAFDMEERKRKGIKIRDNITKLYEYLDMLKRNNYLIPIGRKGRPNKLAIAHACGFARNVFYTNTQVETILEDYMNDMISHEKDKPYGLKTLK